MAAVALEGLPAVPADEGRRDEVIIRCSVGTYVPSFEQRIDEGHAQTMFWNTRIDALQSLLVKKART